MSRFCQESADKAVRFIETYCSHVKGELGGQPFILEDWQKRDIIYPIFGTLREDGLRQYRTVYIELPRKNGKTNLASAIALYMLCAEGEPGAEVVSAAADRNQARICFELAQNMVRQNEVLSRRCKVLQHGIQYKENTYRAISAEAGTKHGFNCSAVVYDEIHAARSRELWDVLATSVGARRQPLVIAITTAGHDMNSICRELHDYAQKVKQGKVEDPSFLPIIYSADRTDDWTQEETWKKANPGYGTICKADYFRQEVQKCKANPRLINTFLRLHLNIWTHAEVRWVTDEEFMRGSASFTEDQLRGLPLYVGVDLASVKDLTAVAMLWVDTSTDVMYLRCLHFINEVAATGRQKRMGVDHLTWERMGLVKITEGNVTDLQAVRSYIEQVHDAYSITALAFDRYYSEMLVPDLIAYGIDCQQFGQGYASMSYPTKQMESLLCKGHILHAGHPVLRWQVGCVQLQRDDADNIKVSKKKNQEGQKVDGWVASIMALGCYYNNSEPAPLLEVFSL